MRRLLPALALVLAACDGSHVVAPRVTVAPATPSPSFVSLLSPPSPPAMHFRVTAPATRPLYLENCNGAVSWGVEREHSGAWVPAWGAEINGCHSAPIEIAAGSTREFHETLMVRSGEPLPPGPYRLAVYGLYFRHGAPDHSGSNEVPHAFRLSEPFALAAGP